MLLELKLGINATFDLIAGANKQIFSSYKTL